jgi:hypothetical protein
MIALLFGDGIVGIIWILRFNTIIANLRGDLKTRLINDYFVDEEFQVCFVFYIKKDKIRTTNLEVKHLSSALK